MGNDSNNVLFGRWRGEEDGEHGRYGFVVHKGQKKVLSPTLPLTLGLALRANTHDHEACKRLLLQKAPTVLVWLREHAPEVLDHLGQIVEP